MRAMYIKAVVEMELVLEELTEKEKVDLLLQLVNDINRVHPDYQLELYRTCWRENDGSLDW